MPKKAMTSYEASRVALDAQHDDGAAEALHDAIDAAVDCGLYCSGGSARIDLTETLAELAEQGWRLVRVADQEPTGGEG